ncbi:MAG TPA: DUF6600 domain-containing protein [Candidatus Sulfotelmatobacter sp.]
MTKTLTKNLRGLRGTIALMAVATIMLGAALAQHAVAQDNSDQDDPPTRVARLGYLQGSVSFQPAGESDWVQAASNRPMTTGDQLWADRDSRAELSLGSAMIDLNSNTGVSILNLDDRTAQIQLSSGSINVRVRHLDRDDVFEIDTPNQAFSIDQPGRYRVEASEDGSYTVVSIREGEGESTGNGENYTLHAGQRATFEGTDRLNAQVEDLGAPDDFDNWSEGRYRRYESSRSARYLSPDMVGYEDLDDNGDWRPDPGYGNVWFPHVAAGWAPYHDGHWAWIDPWGWTWVDDAQWGYAPFHYGRWASVEGRWGWIPGPAAVRPVYAPALVVFVGGGGVGGNMAWFPLGPREVYVPPYTVSRNYVNQVNVSNTTVNVTQVTNVYNTTIVNKTTTITNVTYVNRNVNGAVTAVPQQAFASGQPVAHAAVAVNTREIASAPLSVRAAVAPTRTSVLGVHANTANHVAAPPAAVLSRPIVAKAKVPPPPVPFAARQQALAAHPGQPIAKQQMRQLQQSQPRNTTAVARPPVKQAPPGKPATATPARPGTQPGNPNANRPGSAPANQPMNQPGNQPGNRPGNPPTTNERPGASPAQPNRPEPNRPQPNQPAPNNRPAEPPARSDRPPSAQPNNRPETNRPETTQPQPNRAEPNRPQPNEPAPSTRPAEPPARTDRPPSAQPNNRPEPNRPESNRPQPSQPAPNNRPAEPPARTDRPPAAQPNRPEPSRPETNRPQPNQPAPNNRSAEPPQRTPPPQARPAQPQQHQPTPEEKKKQEEQRKQQEKPQ